MTAQKRNEWTKISEKVLASSPAVEVIQRECVSSEDGRPHRFYLIQSGDWVNIIPVTREGKVVLVRQYRVGISEHTLEIPGGIVDAKDTDVQAGALREMTEETGYVMSEGARCEYLGWSYPNPAIQGNRIHAFVVGPVEKSQDQELDSGEMIEVEEVAIEEIPRKIIGGEINHALILNAFLKLAFQEEEVTRGLLRGLGRFVRAGHPI